MKTEEHCAIIQDKIHREIAKSGLGYLKVGLELLHKGRKSGSDVIEPAIGNLAIAIELMIKSFLAKNNLILLFKDLPLELKILLTCSENIPIDSLNIRHIETELCSFKYNTFELDELIASFYVLFPEHKQALKPYFKLLSRCRNASIHLSLPSFQRYELERTGYLALRVFQILTEKKLLPRYLFHLTKEDTQFLSEYSEERVERVRKKIEEAREKAKKIEEKDIQISGEGWEVYETRCPVCGCGGMLTGETQVEVEFDADGIPNPYLVFSASTFECAGCNVNLDDVEELQLAGMEISYQRPDKDMDKWNEETESYDYGDILENNTP
jgi:hypothetical protein